MQQYSLLHLIQTARFLTWIFKALKSIMNCNAYFHNDFHCISCTDDVHIVMAVTNNKAALRKGLKKQMDATNLHVATCCDT